VAVGVAGRVQRPQCDPADGERNPSSTPWSVQGSRSIAGAAIRLPTCCFRCSAAVMWSAWMCVSSVHASFRPRLATTARSRSIELTTGSMSTASPVSSQPRR
jgi:hypothetical protein